MFSTVSTLKDGAHPVGGNRQFGLTKNDGDYTFFTRGADRPWGIFDPPWLVLPGGERLWNAVMSNMTQYINSNGGYASPGLSFSQYIDWALIKK